MIRRVLVPLLAVAAIGAATKIVLPDAARYMRMRAM